MVILYIFKFKRMNKRSLNTIKRRFYYNFKKLQNLKKEGFDNKKQFFIVDEKDSEKIDYFLNEYLDWLEYYRIKTDSIILIRK